ncbi:MAG: hypothetical protein ABI611_14470 [Solirubrobacteraceae bacterium]
MSEPLAEELAAGGGVTAAPQSAARLRQLLSDALRYGTQELGGKRSGTRERPVTVVLAADGQRALAAVPVGSELHADAEAIGERAWLLVAAVAGALVDLCEPGPPATPDDLEVRTAEGAGGLALIGYPAPGLEPAVLEELGPLAFEDQAGGIDRLRARALVVPAFVLGDAQGLREPLGAAHPLRIAEAVARLGGRPADPVSVEEHDEAVLALLGARGAAARPHEDPDPARRVARRILQRLDGMGKWGGYHTDFAHLARGFAGNDRQLASDVGEALLSAGLLAEKPSVGQRHVFLNPRRAGDIRRLIETGEEPSGLSLARK